MANLLMPSLPAYRVVFYEAFLASARRQRRYGRANDNPKRASQSGGAVLAKIFPCWLKQNSLFS